LDDKNSELMSWENLNFSNTSFSLVLQNLNMIKLQIRLVELAL
jgi:hypothetical protein